MIKLGKKNRHTLEFELPRSSYPDYTNPLIFKLENFPKRNLDGIVVEKIKTFELDINEQTTKELITGLTKMYGKTNYGINKIIKILKGE